MTTAPILLCVGRAVAAALLIPPLLLPPLHGGEAPGLLDDAAGQTADERMRRTQVAALIREGDEQLRLFNQDKARNPTAVVDASIAFAKARRLLGESGPADELAQVQASLFWCKKQMDVPTVKEYLARRGEDGKIAIEQTDAVAALSVDAAQAPAFLAGAEQFAKTNPAAHLQIAIRFIEVAERFPATAEGAAANRRALEAQQAMIAAFQAEAQAARATRFTKPPTVKAGETPVPEAAAQREAVALIRKSFEKQYAKRDTVSKRRLARKLLVESDKNRSPPALYHQFLAESLRLAMESEDYETLMKVVERQSSQFAGLVLGDELRATLRRMGAKPVAQGILKLLDEPADPAANLTVGRWYAFTARRWDDGMPMLANGSDAGLAKLAQMELDKPGEAAERAQLADAWFEAARKPVGKDDRIPMLSRALSWYGEALGGLTGLQKDGVAKRMAEIEKQLPIDVDNIDWKTLTAGQWDRIKAPIVTVQMRLDRTDAQVVLKAGERVRVVAHPSETWTVDLGTWGGVVTTNWRGRKMPAAAMSGVHRMAAMLCWIDNGAKQNCGIIAGPGKLYLGPNSDWWYNPERNGSIRAKIVPVEDDED